MYKYNGLYEDGYHFVIKCETYLRKKYITLVLFKIKSVSINRAFHYKNNANTFNKLHLVKSFESRNVVTNKQNYWNKWESIQDKEFY